jgi:hypothetical protein
MGFEDLMHLSVQVFEAVGVLVLILGSIAAFVTGSATLAGENQPSQRRDATWVG